MTRALLIALALLAVSCPAKEESAQMKPDAYTVAPSADAAYDFGHPAMSKPSFFVHRHDTTNPVVAMLEPPTKNAEDYDYRYVYVSLRDNGSYYKIDRESGDVWVCAGRMNFTEEITCRGLDGTDFPAPIISSLRAGTGRWYNSQPPQRVEWETLSHDDAIVPGSTPATLLNFCVWWRTAAGQDRAQFCKAAGKAWNCDLCPEEKKK